MKTYQEAIDEAHEASIWARYQDTDIAAWMRAGDAYVLASEIAINTRNSRSHAGSAIACYDRVRDLVQIRRGNAGELLHC